LGSKAWAILKRICLSLTKEPLFCTLAIIPKLNFEFGDAVRQRTAAVDSAQWQLTVFFRAPFPKIRLALILWGLRVSVVAIALYHEIELPIRFWDLIPGLNADSALLFPSHTDGAKPFKGVGVLTTHKVGSPASFADGEIYLRPQRNEAAVVVVEPRPISNPVLFHSGLLVDQAHDVLCEFPDYEAPALTRLNHKPTLREWVNRDKI
jgi:hypothetical protein